ncbi:hypothetical protein K9L27_03895 [Candidatus Gracilibacteria bacterium]|nr:hypothetical protein [Candidatus Gracilibacteria bacterium]
MNFIEFLSPLLRKKWMFLLLFVIFSAGLFGASFLLPDVQKITVYFSIKPMASAETAERYSLDPVEAASKIAEAVAGWEQNPAFRQDILDDAGVYIPHFKNKITARRQNRVNVFWTLKLWGDDVQYGEKVTQSLINVFEKHFAQFNDKNSFPLAMTPAQTFSEMSLFPLSWILVASVFLGFVFSFGSIYLWEAFSDRLSFVTQVMERLPESPILRMNKPLGKHNATVLEQFVLTFESPRLIATFEGAGEYFSLAPMDSIDEEIDVPILLVRLGHTRIRDLENMASIFGEDIGIVVFEK